MSTADTKPFSRARFYAVHCGPPVLIGLALALFEPAALDQKLSAMFYDSTLREFPLRHDWFLEVVMHHWAKYLMVMIAVAMLGGFVLSFCIESLKPHRLALLFVFLAMVFGTLGVSGIKAMSNKHCPWDLEIYGGFAPYIPLLGAPVQGIKAGQCFPAGHASGGFSLMAFYFVGMHYGRRRLAHAALAGGFACGFILGFGRIMQGAHFLSHILWAALVCWIVAAVLYPIILQPGQRKTEQNVLPAGMPRGIESGR